MPSRRDTAHRDTYGHAANYRDEDCSALWLALGTGALAGAVGAAWYARRRAEEKRWQRPPDSAPDRTSRLVREADSGHALREAILACRKGGRVRMPGVYGGMLDKFPLGVLMEKGLQLKTGQTRVQRYTKDLLERIGEGKIDTSFMISHRLPLEEDADEDPPSVAASVSGREASATGGRPTAYGARPGPSISRQVETPQCRRQMGPVPGVCRRAVRGTPGPGRRRVAGHPIWTN